MILFHRTSTWCQKMDYFENIINEYKQHYQGKKCQKLCENCFLTDDLTATAGKTT